MTSPASSTSSYSSSSLEAAFLASPGAEHYGYNGRIDSIRQEQYPQIKDAIYLDHAGATLPSSHHLNLFTQDLASTLYANPHSKSPSSLASSEKVDKARRLVLEHFGCSLNGEWDVIFTANATAGIKLVGDAFPWTRAPSSTATSTASSSSTLSSSPSKSLSGSASASSTAVKSLKDGHSSADGEADRTLATPPSSPSMTSAKLTSATTPTAISVTTTTASLPVQPVKQSKLILLRETHTSVVGLRGLADDQDGTDSIQVQMVNQQELENMFTNIPTSSPQQQQTPSSPNNTQNDIVYNLFAYPAQCNFSGRRFPFSWTRSLKSSLDTPTTKHLVLLDAASYAMTSTVSFTDIESSPDFTVLSFYKMFGFPTGLGCVIVKTELAPLLRKQYFGGGTVSAITSGTKWQVFRDSLHGRYEDGTLNFLDIVGLTYGFETIKFLYGSFDQISKHVTSLHRFLFSAMKEIQHYNHTPLVDLYIEQGNDLVGNAKEYGPILNFNLKRSNGHWVGYGDVERLASMRGIHVRTGGFCNPGSMQRWLDLSDQEVEKNLEAGHVCWDDTDILNGKPTGSIRVSLGAMTTLQDCIYLIEFLKEYFVDTQDPDASVDLIEQDVAVVAEGIDGDLKQQPIKVQSVIIYPIKSCRGYKIPEGHSWPIAAHGLLYDREWMLVDAVTGSALTQKRYPRMCMIETHVLLDQNMMVVSLDSARSNQTTGMDLPKQNLYISLDEIPPSIPQSSRVCGDCTPVIHYSSPEINDWFSNFLGQPCRLARQPSATEGMQVPSRYIKNHLNAPDKAPILLSNESPFLMISDLSVEKVRDWIDAQDEGQGLVRRLANAGLDKEKEKRHEYTSDSFRANFVMRGQAKEFEEDDWERIQIGNQVFDILGPCRRCHMVTIDQATAMKNSDVFLALSKHRKAASGQIFFGMHMLHRPDLSRAPFVVHPGDQIRTRRRIHAAKCC